MERPIILKAHEVRGILDGRQTQLRRIIKPQPIPSAVAPNRLLDWQDGSYTIDSAMAHQCPFGQVGDRLWGRETFACSGMHCPTRQAKIHYKADADVLFCRVSAQGYTAKINKTIPSTQMPRWASRILLEIVSVRVERLNDISEMDAEAEGCEALWLKQKDTPDGPQDYAGYSAKSHFFDIWESIHGDRSWDANPWVWVLTFKRVQPA